MKISTPQGLSRCDNRNIKAKTNQISGGPESWFTKENLAQLGYKSFTFDFFVNWEKNIFIKTLWFKRFININISELIKDPNWKSVITKSLIDADGSAYLNDIYNFCNLHHLTADFVIFNEDNWSKEDPIIYARLKGDNLDLKVIYIEDLKGKISFATGRPFKIGKKGLFYSTSKLECHLSTSDTPYPGDADLILTDKNYNIIALVEFKKHNLNTFISEQKLSNYYPRPDGVKYRRLDMLRKYLTNTNLFTLYYTTDSRNITKIELNSYDQFELSEWDTIELSSPSDKSNQNEILDYLVSCANFFNLKNF